ncbi:MAG: prolipoprotein diacylglyceryl transferase, partial [Deltaproteobacteria bacterium]
MHPVLFHIGNFTIYSYGVLVALGFAAGITWAYFDARRQGIDPNKILDLAFYLVLSAIIGARLFYVLIEYRDYLKDPLRALKIWEGGLVFYGGLILAGLTGAWYILHHRLPHWLVMDIFAPGIALGHAIGRIGCFCAGCCYGKVCHCSFGLVFKDPKSLARLGIPLYPTQLISSAMLFIIFFILIFVERRKKFDGQVFWSYVLIYAIARFGIEFLRGDPRGFTI